MSRESGISGRRSELPPFVPGWVLTRLQPGRLFKGRGPARPPDQGGGGGGDGKLPGAGGGKLPTET